MQMWVYDDLRWWIDAIHCACCPVADTLPLKERWVSNNPKDFMECLTSTYNGVLASLRRPGLSPESARTRLFIAKALKKWKYADSQTADARKQKAIAGFVERNDLAASAGLIPWPYSALMKECLEEWLPEPMSTTTGSREDYQVESPSQAFRRRYETWASQHEVISYFEDGALVTMAKRYTAEGVRQAEPVRPSEFTWCTGRFGPGQVAEHWTHPQRFAKLAEWCECSKHWPEAPLDLRHAQSVAARLSAVPKDYTKDRLITVEPAYSSFVQQQVRQVLQLAIHHGPLNGTCMDLGFTDGQAIQRRLALEASKDKKLATLDLKDASDSITWEQVQQVFPAWVTHLLGVSRSTRFRYSHIWHEGNVRHVGMSVELPLNIYAGMGNGTTFTVETLFFAAFVKAYTKAHDLPGFVSVFGDDIICDSRAAARLMAERFPFFVINKEKSFTGTDALRESCGIFAYQGVDISVPKVDGYLNNAQGRQGLADLHRRLIADKEWGPAQWLSLFIAVSCPLPNWSFTCEGFPSIDDDRVERSPISQQHRWNRNHQRKELKLKVSRPKAISYPTDDRTARRHNYPPANMWYQARLCGMIGGGDAKILKRKDLYHGHCCVRVPVKDAREYVEQWVPAWEG